MPRLIIKMQSQQDQRFEIEKPEILIGRGEECDLVLPNISVSREHAIIRLNEHGAEVLDANSENGISVNNQKVKQQQLNSKDEILIGNFSLVYLGDKQEDKFYRGRAIVYLPEYDPKHANPTQDITFKLSAKEAKALVKEKNLLNNGCILDSRGRKLYPEANPMTFGGKNAMVKAEGFMMTGIAATITWDGKRHIIEKQGFFSSLKINGASAKKSALRDKDKFQVGNSNFQYIVVDPS